MKTNLTSAQQAQILAWSQEGIGPAEQARRLGLPVSRILATYRRSIREGLAPKRERQPWRPWTARDRDQLFSLVDQGYGYDAIARRLKRTRTAVMLEAKRRNTRLLATKAALAARGVQELLGLGCAKTVSRWITMGWLKARNGGRPDRPLWRVQWEDLTTFLACEEYWIAWSPERITDAALREWALEIRANAPRLLTHTEVARRCGVERDSVAAWITRGLLPSVRYGNHRIPETALIGFVIPIDRQAPATYSWPTDGWEPLQTDSRFRRYAAAQRKAA